MIEFALSRRRPAWVGWRGGKRPHAVPNEDGIARLLPRRLTIEELAN